MDTSLGTSKEGLDFPHRDGANVMKFDLEVERTSNACSLEEDTMLVSECESLEA